jgi:formylmethanofuran--tetrahydromethanopterin N-formyltransferase
MRVGNVEIDDKDFAEAFPMWACRALITAESERWARTAAQSATGFASSIIMSPAEAGVEGPVVAPEKTPDGRVGVNIQIYHRTGIELKLQMLSRVGQCVLTCPTTAIFDAMPKAVKRLKIGRMVRMFGDGFEERDTLSERKIWRIPVMEGEFIIEDKFGVRRAVAGGNFLIMAENQKAGLMAAEKAVSAISTVSGVVLTFPGGICRSGSKVASRKYKLRASTNEPYCPKLKASIENSLVPDGVDSVYELVFNGVTPTLLRRATARGIRAAATVPGVRKITAVNFGGKLGPIQIKLKEALETDRES